MRIKSPMIFNDLQENIEDKNLKKTSYKSKSTNIEKMIDEEYLNNMSLYELKIILLFQIQSGTKTKIKNPIENQYLNLSLSRYKSMFPNPNSYYKAINSLIELGFMKKVDGKQSVYEVNYKIVSNMTLNQEISLGLKKDFRNEK